MLNSFIWNAVNMSYRNTNILNLAITLRKQHYIKCDDFTWKEYQDWQEEFFNRYKVYNYASLSSNYHASHELSYEMGEISAAVPVLTELASNRFSIQYTPPRVKLRYLLYIFSLYMF